MPKILDLTNSQFGKLKVLYRTKSSKHGYYWLCQCDCGNRVEVLGYNLKSGNTTSCGCNKKTHKKKEDTPINREKRKSIKNQFQPKNIAGYKFGEWVALYRTDRKNSTGSYYWHCQCSCGTERDVDIGSLLSGKSKSCGCIKSFGEKKISHILQENKMSFKQEYSFQNCLTENGNLCRFDFAIFDKNNSLKCLVEYDGKQHFEEGPFDLSKNQLRDKIKNNYCLLNNIPLYRIPYTDLSKVNCLTDIFSDKYLIKLRP